MLTCCRNSMFHTLSNVQRGEAIGLQRYINNREGYLRIGVRSITFKNPFGD